MRASDGEFCTPPGPTSGPDRRTSTPLPAAWSGARSGPAPLWTPTVWTSHRTDTGPQVTHLRSLSGPPDDRTAGLATAGPEPSPARTRGCCWGRSHSLRNPRDHISCHGRAEGALPASSGPLPLAAGRAAGPPDRRTSGPRWPRGALGTLSGPPDRRTSGPRWPSTAAGRPPDRRTAGLADRGNFGLPCKWEHLVTRGRPGADQSRGLRL